MNCACAHNVERVLCLLESICNAFGVAALNRDTVRKHDHAKDQRELDDSGIEQLDAGLRGGCGRRFAHGEAGGRRPRCRTGSAAHDLREIRRSPGTQRPRDDRGLGSVARRDRQCECASGPAQGASEPATAFEAVAASFAVAREFSAWNFRSTHTGCQIFREGGSGDHDHQESYDLQRHDEGRIGRAGGSDNRNCIHSTRAGRQIGR